MENGEFHLTLNGIRHWCRIDGAGRSNAPLVALHGGPGGNHYVFERTILPLLQQFVTVVCYEQRGCGRSDPPSGEDDYSIAQLVSDLDELRRALSCDRLFLLGYSFGGELALEYALAHPTRVLALVLQAPSGIVDDDRAARIQLAGFREVGTDPTVLEGADTVGDVRGHLARVWRDADVETVDRFLFQDQAVARRNRGLWQVSGLVNTGLMERALERKKKDRVPLGERLQRLTIPTLMLVGGYDRNMGIEVCREATESLAGGRLHVFERSAHFPDLEEPEQYVQVVRDFLRDVQEGRP